MAANITTHSPSDSPTDIVGILDDLNATKASAPGPPCSVRVALERIAAQDPELVEAVRARVDDPDYPAAGVAQVLTDRTGARVSSYMMRRHRKRGTANGCRCPR